MHKSFWHLDAPERYEAIPQIFENVQFPVLLKTEWGRRFPDRG